MPLLQHIDVGDDGEVGGAAADTGDEDRMMPPFYISKAESPEVGRQTE